MVSQFKSVLSRAAIVVGLMTSSAVQAQQVPAQDMTQDHPIDFSLADFDGSWINAIGRFDDDAPERFRSFLEFYKEIKAGATVQFSSNGGSLTSGMRIGAMIQAHQLNTFVGDTKYMSGVPVCASACTLAFVGGIQRHVETQAEFLIHAPRLVRPDGSDYLPDEKVFSARDLAGEQRSMSLVLHYARNQGVDPAAIVAMYEVFPYGSSEESSRRLTQEDLAVWRIDNHRPLPQHLRESLQDVDRLRQELCPPPMSETR